jgi:hypothetical protein
MCWNGVLDTRSPQVPSGCLRIGLGGRGRGHRLASARKCCAGKKTQHRAGVLILLLLLLVLQGSRQSIILCSSKTENIAKSVLTWRGGFKVCSTYLIVRGHRQRNDVTVCHHHQYMDALHPKFDDVDVLEKCGLHSIS